MAWNKAGSTSLGSANANITLTSLSNNKFSNVMINTLGASTNSNVMLQLGNGSTNTGTNYAYRQCANGGSEEAGSGQQSQSSIIIGGGSGTHPKFVVGYICNISGEEKLCIFNSINRRATGAANAPERTENVGKWSIINNPVIDTITVNSSSGTFNSDSNLSVLGSDGVASMKVQDGAIFYETDTNKSYVLNNNTWSEV